MKDFSCSVTYANELQRHRTLYVGLCRPYSAGILHSVSNQIQNLPNCFTTPNKMTTEDGIKGLVSLKFLRPCS